MSAPNKRELNAEIEQFMIDWYERNSGLIPSKLTLSADKYSQLVASMGGVEDSPYYEINFRSFFCDVSVTKDDQQKEPYQLHWP